MFKLNEDINGFNVDATFTHIGKSEVLIDDYKSEWRMLRPQLSVVLTYKNRSVVKEYTLSAMNLIQNVKVANRWGQKRKYTGKSVFYTSEAYDNNVYIEEGNSRTPLYATNSQSNTMDISDLVFEYNPSQEDLMYVLWGCLMDYMMIYEYDENEFGQMFMGDSCGVESLRKSDAIYSTLKNDVFELGINEDIIYQTMEQLREKGIE